MGAREWRRFKFGAAAGSASGRAVPQRCNAVLHRLLRAPAAAARRVPPCDSASARRGPPAVEQEPRPVLSRKLPVPAGRKPAARPAARHARPRAGLGGSRTLERLPVLIGGADEKNAPRSKVVSVVPIIPRAASCCTSPTWSGRISVGNDDGPRSWTLQLEARVQAQRLGSWQAIE